MPSHPSAGPTVGTYVLKLWPPLGSTILLTPGMPLAATTQTLVQAALQQHLSHLVAVHGVQVENDDGALRVTVAWRLLRDDTAGLTTLQVPGRGT